MSSSPPVQVKLDFSGLSCPLPILRAKKALAPLHTGEIIELTCTDPATPKDFAAFCARTGNVLIKQWQSADKFFFLIQKR